MAATNPFLAPDMMARPAAPPPGAGKNPFSAADMTAPAPSLWDRFMHGVVDPVVGAGQLMTHVPGSLWSYARPVVDPLVRLREETYQRERGPNAGFDWARLAGNVASPINYAIPELGAAATAGRLGEAGKAAVSGALAGAMQPTATKPGAGEGDYWTSKAKDLALGAATGGALGGVAAGVGRGVAAARGMTGAVGGPAAALARSGVTMTPGALGRGSGRIVGQLVGRAEDALKSWPILGDVIRRAGSLGIRDFNRAVLDQTLEPIGKTLPKGMSAGREAVKAAAEMISDDYGRILSQKGLRFTADPKFAQDILGIYRSARGQPGNMVADLQSVVRSSLFDRFKLRSGSGPSMDAAAFKMSESRLNGIATRYMRSPDVNQQLLGEHIKEVVYAMRSALERQNPQAARDLANVNAAFAMLARVERAARSAKEDGVFTPSQLLSAVRSSDTSRRGRAFAHGDALMQAFAEAGQRVLPGRMPDSGTPERALWSALVYGLSKGTLREAAAGAVPAATLGPLYTRAGMKAVQRWALAGPQRNAAISRLGGAAGAGAVDARVQNDLSALNAVLSATEPPPAPPVPQVGDRGPSGGKITDIERVPRPSPTRGPWGGTITGTGAGAR